MKRKFLLLALIVISSAQIANSQIKKGTLFLGGQVGFGTSKTEYDAGKSTQTSYSFSPAAGVFTKDNLVWGGDIFLQGYKSKSEVITSQKQLYTGVGVFVRQYFPVANRFYLFGQGRAGVNYQKEEQSNTSSNIEIKGYSVGISIYPGISYAIRKNIHLETGFNNLASINYTHAKRVETSQFGRTEAKSNSFGLGGSLNNAVEFSIGIRFLLEKV